MMNILSLDSVVDCAYVLIMTKFNPKRTNQTTTTIRWGLTSAKQRTNKFVEAEVECPICINSIPLIKSTRTSCGA